jgi:hypothetical protein
VRGLVLALVWLIAGCGLTAPAVYDRQGLSGCVRVTRIAPWAHNDVLMATGSATMDQCIRAMGR